MPTVLAAADAGHFRVKHGRFSERWYTDPLPACDIAPAIQPDEAWPSFSTIKKASGSDWSFVAMKRIAQAPDAELERLLGLDPAQRYDTCKSINSYGLNVSAGRGTIGHWWGEDMLHRRKPRVVTPQMLSAHRIPAESLERAKPYGRALRDWFDAYQPELVATEYVAIHRDLNGVGYGCTPDGLMKIDGDVYAYDFKTRSEDGDHAAYPEEGAQIAAGARAQYRIIERDGEAHRHPMPDIAGGLIISIKPDGVRLYPVDIDKAWTHFERMHAWWVARRDERASIGRPWPVKTKEASCATTSGSSSTKTDDSKSATSSDISTPSSSPEPNGSLPSIDSSTPSDPKSSTTTTPTPPPVITTTVAARPATSRRAADNSSSTTDPPEVVDVTGSGTAATPSAAVPTRADVVETLGYEPEEGPGVEADAFEVLERIYAGLDEGTQIWFAQIVGDAKRASVPFHANTTKTLRRFELYRGLLVLAENGDCVDDIARAIAAEAHGTEAPLSTEVTTGHAVGALSAPQAVSFARYADDYVACRLDVLVHDDGLLRVAAA